MLADIAYELRGKHGVSLPLPALAAAFEQSLRLAELRGRSAPLRNDVNDALTSCFIKGDADSDGTLILSVAQRLFCGNAIGHVPLKSNMPPLVRDFSHRARRQKLKIDGSEPRRTLLNIYRSQLHRETSRLLHQSCFLGIPFALRTAGPDFVSGYGLVTALESAEQKNLSPASLIGRARSQYEPVNRLDHIGLGASPWRTASGYVGLTMVFWSLTDRCFLSCSDARPESQRGFNPITRYRASGPWSGLNSPAQATGHRIHLAGAQVNGLGRISASENCHATVQPIATAEELLNQLEICSQWSLLYQERATAKLSLLAEPEPMRDWVALKPERFGEAFFDQARQVLVWPLFDSGGLVILATLPYSEFNRYAMERIERLDMSALSRGSVLIARVRNSAVGLVADPLSLIMAESPNPANPVDALYFSDSFTSSLSPPHMERAIEDISHRTSGKGPYATSPLIPPMLNEFRAWALRQAEKGTDHWTKTGAGIEL